MDCAGVNNAFYYKRCLNKSLGFYRYQKISILQTFLVVRTLFKIRKNSIHYCSKDQEKTRNVLGFFYLVDN